jgi:hypothetical protein
LLGFLAIINGFPLYASLLNVYGMAAGDVGYCCSF